MKKQKPSKKKAAQIFTGNVSPAVFTTFQLKEHVNWLKEYRKTKGKKINLTGQIVIPRLSR